MEDKIKVVAPLPEYLLSPAEMTKYKSQKETSKNNLPNFKLHLMQGVFNQSEGYYVVYSNGVLCGQSKERGKLHNQALALYGKNSFEVFRVNKS